ncbi:Connectin [Papilio machaon]|uniref:Connectin n=1 Tax=Papilio machaon TaxID=76193 RepID=A0A194RMP0_PAPMA|nr:Connectin [Papilio machaon]
MAKRLTELDSNLNRLVSLDKVEGMRALIVPATLLLLVFALELDATRRKQKEKVVQTTINICDISDRDSKVHCYCEFSQDFNEAVKTECWVFNGGIDKSDSLWSSFTSQSNIENLAFNVRADGGLNFNQIVNVERHTFYNLPNLTVLTLDENKITRLVSETFYELPSLHKLYLTSNNISVIEDGTFRHLVNLLELELDRNNINELKKECFDGLANLKRLDLRRNKLTVLKSFTFTELWNLQELLLDYNEIHALAQRTFDGLSLLKKLSLSHNKLIALISGLFEGVRGLSALDLRYNKLKRFTYDNVKPIYDNLKNQKSYIYLDGNDFDCDCHLAWMHKLRHEARSIKVRTSLENFVCKFNIDPAMNSHLTYYEKTIIDTNNIFIDEKPPDKEYKDLDDLQDDIDEEFIEEPKVIKKENERTLLQIPVELLPCPAVVNSVTDRTYTYPSQNEAKDYRNLILTSKSNKFYISLVIFSLNLMFLI